MMIIIIFDVFSKQTLSHDILNILVNPINMKTIKKILITIIIAVSLFLIIAYFLPSQIIVDRSITIKAPAGKVFEQVNNFRNWDNWIPWHQIDSSMTKSYFGNESGLGSGYEWSSEHKNVGSGKGEIMFSKNNDSIAVNLLLMQSPALCRFKFTQTDTGIVVVWGYTSEIGLNPFSRYVGTMAEGVIGKNLDKSLLTLKKYLESTKSYTCKKIRLNETNYVSVQITCLNSDIQKEMGKAYANLMVFIEQSDTKSIGAPLCFYHNIDIQSCTFEAAIPVSKKVQGNDDVMSKTLKAGEYATTAYYGSYANINEAYTALTQWMSDNKIEAKGMPFDEYVTNPSEVKDTSKWITNVYYPL